MFRSLFPSSLFVNFSGFARELDFDALPTAFARRQPGFHDDNHGYPSMTEPAVGGGE